MKNVRLILFTIATLLFLNSCAGNSDKKNSSISTTAATSPISQTAGGSKATIDSKLLQEYQDSQKNFIELLRKRSIKDSSEKIDDKIRDALNKELPNFNQNLDNIQAATTDQEIQDKVKNFKEIISFKDLSGKNSDLKNLQQKLAIQGKNIGEEEGKFFGKKTSQALTEKIEEFGKDLQTLAKPIPPVTTPATIPPSPPQPPTSSADFNWLSALTLLLSILSLVGSFIAWNKTKNTAKKQKTNSQHSARSSNQLSSNLYGGRASSDLSNDRSSDEVNQLKYEVNALKSDLQETNSNYTSLLNKFNKLSQQQTNNPPSNYREEIRSSSDYGGSVNRDQFAGIPGYYSVNTPISPPPQSAWINEYNQNSRSFYTKYVEAEVLEEEHNIEGRRSGKISTVNLSIAPQRTGGYWVFDQDNQLMLVPSSEVRINKFNRDTIDAMFDYSDFNSNYRQIRLIEPAIVESNVARGYQLIRRGRIEFE